MKQQNTITMTELELNERIIDTPAFYVTVIEIQNGIAACVDRPGGEVSYLEGARYHEIGDYVHKEDASLVPPGNLSEHQRLHDIFYGTTAE